VQGVAGSNKEGFRVIMTKLEGKEVAQMWVMAAYVEMVEPSA